MSNDVTMYAGETKYLDVTLTDKDKGKLLDLTGSTLSWTMKPLNGVAVTLTKTNASGISITNATGGQCEIVLASADTTGLSGVFTQQLKVTDSYNNVSVVLQGQITITPAN